MNTASARAFDPFESVGSSLLAEVPGFRVTRVALAAGEQIPWHRSTGSTLLFFAMGQGLAVQIQRPPFCCVLDAGECYSVPPGVDLTAFGEGAAAVEFVAFEYGERLDRIASCPPTLAHVGVRSSRPSGRSAMQSSGAHKTHTPEHTARLVPGLSRMDVLASPENLRLIVQGHGIDECVPLHSHDRITDTFFCVNGHVRIETKDPDAACVMVPGDIFSVPPGVAHLVSGNAGEPCEVMILQGVGSYNYVPR